MTQKTNSPDTKTTPRILRHGVDSLVVQFATVMSDEANRAALAFRAALDADPVPGVVETSPALASVYLRINSACATHESVESALRAHLGTRDWYAAPFGPDRQLWRIPTVFGGDAGPQLAEAADLAGRTPDEAIRELSTTPVRVLALGFAPGQPYLGQLPENWGIPRQSGLTPQVPEGALTVAVRQFVLFANPSPTGWRHVGQTAFRCFRPEASDPFPLKPSDEVLFTAVSQEDLAAIRESDPVGGGAQAEAIR